MSAAHATNRYRYSVGTPRTSLGVLNIASSG
jgi:hypothetical protein